MKRVYHLNNPGEEPCEGLVRVRYVMSGNLRKVQMPNEMTVRAFAEDKHSMPIFDTVDELRRDLVVKRKISVA